MSNLNPPQHPQYPPYPQPSPPPMPSPPGYGPPPPVPPAPPRRRRGRTLRIVLIVLAVLVVGGIASALNGRADRRDPTPTPTPAAAPSASAPAPVTLSAFDLSPGDCYNAAPLPAEGTSTVVFSVQSVPCTQPHTAQVVAVPDYAGRSHGEVIATLSVTDCTQAFQTKLRPAVLKDRKYRPGRIYPDAVAWEQRSTAVACVVATEAPITGSALRG